MANGDTCERHILAADQEDELEREADGENHRVEPDHPAELELELLHHPPAEDGAHETWRRYYDAWAKSRTR